MTRSDGTLRLTGRMLRLLRVLNLAMGAGILALLLASLLAGGVVMSALGVPADAPPRLGVAMRIIAVLGLVSVGVVHRILGTLEEIVATVRAGDPFLRDNAVRMRAIAWLVLGSEVLHLAVGGAAAVGSTAAAPLDVGWGFSVTRWLAVLLLFVLAGVFEQGSSMRDDLAGTV